MEKAGSMTSEAGPSSPRRRSPSPTPDSSDDEGGFGLGDLIPEPESPLPAPYSFAAYEPPEEFSLDLPDDRSKIITRLVGSHPLWGHYLWNTSKVLSTYLLRNPTVFRGKRILELGAGAGLPGLVAGVSGAERVVITDYPDEQLVDNIRWNVGCNVQQGEQQHVLVDGFVWGANVKGLLELSKGKAKEGQATTEGYEVLILSDLVFNHSQHSALVASVSSLLVPTSEEVLNTSSEVSPDLGNTPCVLIFFTHHRPRFVDADMGFFPLLAESGEGWAYEKVVEEFAGAMFENDPGDAQIRGLSRAGAHGGAGKEKPGVNGHEESLWYFTRITEGISMHLASSGL